MVCQGLDDGEVTRRLAAVLRLGQDRAELKMNDVNVGARPARSWWDVVARKKRGNSAMISDPRPDAPVSSCLVVR